MEKGNKKRDSREEDEEDEDEEEMTHWVLPLPSSSEVKTEADHPGAERASKTDVDYETKVNKDQSPSL